MTYIVKTHGSIISTYIAENGREIKSIKFYNKETKEVIAFTNQGWLTETNPYGSDMRLNGFLVKGEIKNYNASANIEKKMSLGENFTVNVAKEYHFDEPACELYVAIDNESVKVLRNEKQQELISTCYDKIQATTYFYNVVELEIQEDTDKRTSVSFKNNIDSREEDCTQENEILNKTCETIKELGIYIDKSDVGKILNKFNLVQKDNSLQEQIAKRVQQEHSDEKYDKIIAY